MKKLRTYLLCIILLPAAASAQWTGEKKAKGNPDLRSFSICVDSNDAAVIQTAARLLQQDIEAVTGYRPAIRHHIMSNANQIIIGTIGLSKAARELTGNQQQGTEEIAGVWEAGWVHSFSSPSTGNTIVLVSGADARGTAFAVMELSRQLGVSPWYWWADVPVARKNNLYVNSGYKFHDAPKVKYRGIFINDEAPALSGWAREKFGGFNRQFYSKVFELLLRLKANYIWPAMWGNAFYDDDPKNIEAAKEYGIVIGTSHHEPMMRAHDEWRRYGKGGAWNYEINAEALRKFWREGLQRADNEKIVTVGMRGDGDEPMTRETATALLEKIVADQRQIIEELSDQPAASTPQAWALYKEVQDYYDKGMRVPDDVTLLLCDDNWGNIRRLPSLSEKPRKGGYGIYYHFDYVGGPRNYKWINTNPLPRIWEQMHLAWQYNVRQIWIVNVGDIKPMEFPISFFLDYAWNPEKIAASELQTYSEKWAAAQFGPAHAQDIADMLAKYAKYNSRRKPELLDADTYNFHYDEWPRVVKEYNSLLEKAESIRKALPLQYHDAYFQLVLHPVKASANLYEMYYNVALNQQAYANKWEQANKYADRVKRLYEEDSLITLEYHRLNNGKWNHMMSQTHIGYTYWQQPEKQTMPQVYYVPEDSVAAEPPLLMRDAARSVVPAGVRDISFYEDEEQGISIEAHHFSRAVNSNGITWEVLPDHGRTGSAITPFPVTAKAQQPGGSSPHVAYDIYTLSAGELTLQAYFSPTLNLHNTPQGLQYAISIDDEEPQIISINKEDTATGRGIWNEWVAENIIIRQSRHRISSPGKHTVKYWMADPGVVLQKLVLDFGNNKPSYLGPPETLYQPSKK